MKRNVRIVRSSCRVCRGVCQVLVHLDNTGKVVRITGDKESPASRGFICPKAACVHGDGGLAVDFCAAHGARVKGNCVEGDKRTQNVSKWENPVCITEIKRLCLTAQSAVCYDGRGWSGALDSLNTMIP